MPSEVPAAAPDPNGAKTLGQLYRDPEGRFTFYGFGLALLILIGFYSLWNLYGLGRTQSTLVWWWTACNDENDYEHGRLIPLAILALLYLDRHRLAAAVVKPEARLGLTLLVFGCIFFLLSVRVLQPRLAVGAIPFFVLGASMYLWGWRTSAILAFPLALTYFAIPVPGLQQATTHLQLISTKTAYHLASLFGADIYAAGNMIGSKTGAWEELNIAGGCSGIRSLVALTTIAAVYAYKTQDKLWKMAVLFASSLPLALVANGLRITAIVLLSEYGDDEFARGGFHNISGFIFFPVGIAGLMLVDMALNRRLPWAAKKQYRTVRVRRGPKPEPLASPES